MKKKKGNKSLIIIIIVVVLLALIGLLVPKFLNKDENNKGKTEEKEEKVVGKEIDKDDQRFFSTYFQLEDVTYDTPREAGYESINGKEMMSIISKDLNTTDFTQEGNYYTIDVQRVLLYIKLYFPVEATIRAEEAVDENYVYPTTTNLPGGQGMTIVGYDNNKFKVKFTEYNEPVEKGAKIFPRTIESAVLANSKDLIEVKEKAIYVSSETKDGKVIYTVYSDPEKTKKIDTKEYNVGEDEGQVITAVNYLEKASTITHRFKYEKSSDKFVFASSKIK